MTFAVLKQKMTAALEAAGVDNAAYDARALLLSAAGLSVEQYLMKTREDVPESVTRKAMDFAARRAKHEPLQYILGKADFYGYEFRVRPGVLIPRYDTEILVEEALRKVRPGQRILDLCTGSGCIILTLLLEAGKRFPAASSAGRKDGGEGGVTGVGADISGTALATARENADSLGVRQASFLKSDLYEHVRDRYDIITSNPPYIRSRDIASLSPEVRDFEPRLALDGSDDGLLFYRRIAEGAPAHLKTGGWIFLEIGFDEAEDVAGILSGQHFKDIEVHQDLAGLDRVVSGRYYGDY